MWKADLNRDVQELAGLRTLSWWIELSWINGSKREVQVAHFQRQVTGMMRAGSGHRRSLQPIRFRATRSGLDSRLRQFSDR